MTIEEGLKKLIETFPGYSPAKIGICATQFSQGAAIKYVEATMGLANDVATSRALTVEEAVNQLIHGITRRNFNQSKTKQ